MSAPTEAEFFSEENTVAHHPAPTSLEEELDMVLNDYREYMRWNEDNADRTKARIRAKSQLKQLILKDVLDLIGPDVEVLTDVIPSESYYLGKNAEKKSLRQSARKRYQS